MDAATLRDALQAALADHQAGRPDAAEAGYRRILAAFPRHPDALHLLGLLAHQRGRHEEAVALIGEALAAAPGHAAAHSNLGNALQALGRLDEAAAAQRRALALVPDYAEAWSNLGGVLAAQGRPAEALDCYGRALALRSELPEAHCGLGFALLGLERHAEAIASLRRALELRADLPEAHNNLGMALEAAGEPAAAVASLRRALALRADFPEAHNNLGNALKASGEFDAAIASYRRALELRPGYAEAHNNLGQALEAAGRVAEAIGCYREAQRLRPGFAPAFWNEALARLLEGDHAAGWRLFEWRFALPGRRLVRDYPVPAWRGQAPLASRTLLVHYEQGFGDTLQMLRYVPLLARQGARVVLEVPAPLATLAATLPAPPGTVTVVAEGAPLPAFELECPLMSLPLAFGTTLDTVPAEVPYLAAPEPERRAWRERLGPRARRRIGLAWSGSPGVTSGMRQRRLPLAALAPLLDLDAEFHSLQKEYRDDDRARLAAEPRIRDHAGALVDFAATAALLEQMDLVISVDTAVAHLAGALGRPTWLLVQSVPDWRWMRERADSPWYPTLRLFRQPAFGAWEPVIGAVYNELVAATDAAAPGKGR